VLAVWAFSASAVLLGELDPAADVDSEPAAKMPEIGETRVSRLAGGQPCLRGRVGIRSDVAGVAAKRRRLRGGASTHVVAAQPLESRSPFVSV
jgi:hypothetical protein